MTVSGSTFRREPPNDGRSDRSTSYCSRDSAPIGESVRKQTNRGTRHPPLIPSTTMDQRSSPLAAQHNLVRSWLGSSANDSCILLTPPPDECSKSHPAPLKRKRAMSLPTSAPVPSSHRSESPKRRRTEDVDDVHPAQSASQLGSETPLALTERNTFSPPGSRVSSSAKRSSSPTRETPIILRSAWPPVLTESLNGLREAPPEQVERLGDRLAEGVDLGFIPQGLQACAPHSVYLSNI